MTMRTPPTRTAIRLMTLGARCVLGPKPRVLFHDRDLTLMPIEPSKYIDVDTLTPTIPFSAEPVKVKEEPQDDDPFPWKDVDTAEVIDLDGFPSDDDELS